MNASKRLATLVMVAAATALTPGCDHDALANGDDHDPRADGDDHDLVFRSGGDRDGPGKLNTNFLGFDELLPLNNIPRAEGAEANVELLEIRSDHCRDSAGVAIAGEFTTAVTNSHLGLTLSTQGFLGSIRMTKVADPTFHCTISGDQWEDTYWDIRVTNGDDVIETDLWLVDLATDDNGYRLYEWYVNYLGIDPTYVGEVIYFPTCNEDVSNTAEPSLSMHAYMVKDLHVDEATGDFSTAANTMYMACLSGSVGKAMAWGYTPDTGFHPMATRMVRADYCGDGTPHTAIGTMIRLQDLLVEGNEDPPPNIGVDYTVEAMWDTATGKATCVYEPRIPGSFDWTCGLDSMDECTLDHLSSAEIVTYVPLPLPPPEPEP